MKNVVKVIYILLCFICMIDKINATCDNRELNDWAEKLNIELIQVKDDFTYNGKTFDYEIPYSYLLLLNNPREDIIVKAKDTYSSGTYNVEYDNDFKNYVIGSEVHFENKIYIITISMKNDSEVCAGEKMKTINYTVPSYNKYHDTLYCEENPNDEICGTYVEVKNKDKANEIVKEHYDDKIEEIIQMGEPWYEKVFNVIKEYYLYVLVPFVLLFIIYNVVILIVKKRSEKA